MTTTSTERTLAMRCFELAIAMGYIPIEWHGKLRQILEDVFEYAGDHRRFGLRLEEGLGPRYCLWSKLYMDATRSTPEELTRFFEALQRGDAVSWTEETEIPSAWIQAWKTACDATDEELRPFADEWRETTRRHESYIFRRGLHVAYVIVPAGAKEYLYPSLAQFDHVIIFYEGTCELQFRRSAYATEKKGEWMDAIQGIEASPLVPLWKQERDGTFLRLRDVNPRDAYAAANAVMTLMSE